MGGRLAAYESLCIRKRCLKFAVQISRYEVGGIDDQVGSDRWRFAMILSSIHDRDACIKAAMTTKASKQG